MPARRCEAQRTSRRVKTPLEQVRFLVARAIENAAQLPPEQRAEILDGAALALDSVKDPAAKDAREAAALLREAERAQLRFFQNL